MRRYGFSLIALLGSWTAVAVAQQYGPVQQPQNFAPNYFNRGSQPVSPYLNLLNGGNPAANYYYGVRPGTIPNNGGFGGGGGNSFQGGFGIVQPIYAAREPQTEPDDVKKFKIPSAGGAVGFGNYFGSSHAGLAQSGGGGADGQNRPASGSSINQPKTPAAKTPSTIPKTK